jgi:hypothetical protein
VHSPRYRSDGVLIVVTRPEQRLGCPLDFLEIKVTTAAAQSPLFILPKITMSSLRKTASIFHRKSMQAVSEVAGSGEWPRHQHGDIRARRDPSRPVYSTREKVTGSRNTENAHTKNSMASLRMLSAIATSLSHVLTLQPRDLADDPVIEHQPADAKTGLLEIATRLLSPSACH